MSSKFLIKSAWVIPFPAQADSPEDEVLSSATRRNALADEF